MMVPRSFPSMCISKAKKRSRSAPARRLLLIFAAGGMTIFATSLPGATETHLDVSKIIDKAEAESILGEPVKDPTPFNGEGKDGYYSKCSYYSVTPGKSLVIRVQQPNAKAIDPRTELKLVAEGSGAMTPVSGVGDEAQMSSEGGDTGAASHIVMLYVVKGNNFLVVGLSGFAENSVALDKEKTVVQKILEHL
jgi:hypothetical protein